MKGVSLNIPYLKSRTYEELKKEFKHDPKLFEYITKELGIKPKESKKQQIKGV